MDKLVVLETAIEVEEIITNNKDISSLILENEIDYYTFGFIVNVDKQNLIEALLKEAKIFEEAFTVYQLNLNVEKKDIFTDFGIISHKRIAYLYEQLVIPFSMFGNNKQDVQRALEQMDEHLVAIEKEETRTIYYVERYHLELIEGIANAYKVNIISYI